jgi:hypothetical protein
MTIYGTPLAKVLKMRGFISRAIYALTLSTKSKKLPGYLQFGDYDKVDANGYNMSIQWLSIRNNTWMVEVASFIYNNQSVDDGEVNYAIFDSIYRGVHLPYSEFDKLSHLFSKKVDNLNCDLEDGVKQCFFSGKCAQKKNQFDRLYFRFSGNTSYSLTPDYYLYDLKNDKKQDMCGLLITGTHDQSDKYVLGNIFMQQNYVIFDYDTAQIGISGVTAYVDIARPNDALGIPFWLVIVIMTIVIGILLIIIGWLFMKLKYRKLLSQLSSLEETDDNPM